MRAAASSVPPIAAAIGAPCVLASRAPIAPRSTSDTLTRAPRQIPPHHDPACWGCGDNPTGLNLPLPSKEGLTEYEAYFSFDERHQGGPGIVHGGLVAGALDEAVGLLATWYAFPTVTVRIFVRYRLPVPINTELLLTAHLVDAHGRRLHVDGAISDGDQTLAECKAALLQVPLEHFLMTPEGRSAAERWLTD